MKYYNDTFSIRVAAAFILHLKLLNRLTS